MRGTPLEDGGLTVVWVDDSSTSQERPTCGSRTPAVLGDGADDRRRWKTFFLGVIADSHLCGTSVGTAGEMLRMRGEERRKPWAERHPPRLCPINQQEQERNQSHGARGTRAARIVPKVLLTGSDRGEVEPCSLQCWMKHCITLVRLQDWWRCGPQRRRRTEMWT